jgi:hypothetical protein
MSNSTSEGTRNILGHVIYANVVFQDKFQHYVHHSSLFLEAFTICYKLLLPALKQVNEVFCQKRSLSEAASFCHLALSTVLEKSSTLLDNDLCCMETLMFDMSVLVHNVTTAALPFLDFLKHSTIELDYVVLSDFPEKFRECVSDLQLKCSQEYCGSHTLVGGVATLQSDLNKLVAQCHQLVEYIQVSMQLLYSCQLLLQKMEEAISNQ